ncbi:MAG: type 4a pilus biogenesis protein PilO [Neisseriaceae bacterium]|nr:type 4a pilus biogenesis protein PilO [Neisseriaceae bacterium]
MKSSSLDINKLYLQSKGVQLVIAAVLAVLILVLGYFILFQSQIEEYQAAQEKEDSLKSEYTSKAQMAASLENLKQELTLIEESTNVLLKQLPTDAQIPSLIQEMHQAAAKNGLTMNNVTPQAVVKDEQIQRLPFAISVTGTHEQIINFARDMGRMSRIVTLSDLSLKNVDAKSATGSKLTFDALANTYKALDVKAASAASAASETE